MEGLDGGVDGVSADDQGTTRNAAIIRLSPLESSIA